MSAEYTAQTVEQRYTSKIRFNSRWYDSGSMLQKMLTQDFSLLGALRRQVLHYLVHLVALQFIDDICQAGVLSATRLSRHVRQQIELKLVLNETADSETGAMLSIRRRTSLRRLRCSLLTTLAAWAGLIFETMNAAVCGRSFARYRAAVEVDCISRLGALIGARSANFRRPAR
jgi:hypothetical protein